DKGRARDRVTHSCNPSLFPLHSNHTQTWATASSWPPEQNLRHNPSEAVGAKKSRGSDHMAITVQSVDLQSKKNIEHFLHLPWSIYVTPDGKRDPNWVPPFLPDQRSLLHPHKNPYHQHSRTKLFMAFNAKKALVGRISASVDDNFNTFWQAKVGFFGWF